MEPLYVLLLAGLLVFSEVNAEMTQDDKDDMLALHIAARIAAIASDMSDLSWSDALAADAQAYADTCPEGHDPNLSGQGENLYWGTPPRTAANAMASWVDGEIDNFVYGKDTWCIDGTTCGHYTQVVWADTTQVGCGKKTCDGILGWTQGVVYVCRYSPPGNYVGQLPYTASANRQAVSLFLAFFTAALLIILR